MTTLFTEIDLIRYIYGETTETEKTEIENAAIVDSDLEEELFGMKLNANLLDKLSFNPSEFSLKKILNFSSTYQSDLV